jgi:hypothetical protein
VSAAALRAGKHVSSEKLLAIDPNDADSLLSLAADRYCLLAFAPRDAARSGTANRADDGRQSRDRCSHRGECQPALF